jgi:hypothetical protein
LNIENDTYQFAKQNFNVAMASSNFDPQISPPGSDQYLALSNLYNESMQSLFVLLLSKRIALYFIATVATVYAGWRSNEGIQAIKNGYFSGPGEALDRINSEILDGEPYRSVEKSTQFAESEDDEKNVFATLIDQNEESSNNAGKTLAIGLPLALTASLAISYGIVVAGKSNEAQTITSDANALSEVQTWILTNPYLASFPGLVLCLLCVSAEFRRVFPSKELLVQSNHLSKEQLLCQGNVLAFFYVLGAYFAKTYPTITFNGDAIQIGFDLWPLQNGVNIALATTVTRALGPFLVPTAPKKSIRTTALALVGVTLFDGISVFGTSANAAVDISSETSVMEVVARSKLASQSSNMIAPWQPGLMEIIIGHDNNQVSDALGLADCVFPAVLVAWALNADAVYCASTNDNQKSLTDSVLQYQYTFAATFGYLVASLFVEVIGSFALLGNRGGLPALVFLVPTMLLCVSTVAWRRGELNEVWGDV